MGLDSGLPETVGDTEVLAHFLVTSSEFNLTSVRKSALLPSNKTKDLSVTRHDGDPLADLEAIGRAQLPKVYGAAMLQAADYRAEGLAVLAAEPPPRHANVTQWPYPDHDPRQGKAQRMEIAKSLAAKAALRLFGQ